MRVSFSTVALFALFAFLPSSAGDHIDKYGLKSEHHEESRRQLRVLDAIEEDINGKSQQGLILDQSSEPIFSQHQAYLDREKTKIDGLAFLGLSLTRHSPRGHPGSATHQTAFDFNDIQDREYNFVESTNDDGWLAGGGEPGPPKSYKLRAKDSSHIEIMRIGTHNPEWGGLTEEDIIFALESGRILIPQVEIVPTNVTVNHSTPPELEIRFDMDPAIPDFEDTSVPLPVNWQLRFLHNQLFKYFQFPAMFCPGPFHSTFVRKVQFRSRQHEEEYFKKCDDAVKKWRIDGPKPLQTDNHGHNSGIYLFSDRTNIVHYFKPNFLPPYDSPEKKGAILNYLREEWDAVTLEWKPLDETHTPRRRKPSPAQAVTSSPTKNTQRVPIVKGKKIHSRNPQMNGKNNASTRSKASKEAHTNHATGKKQPITKTQKVPTAKRSSTSTSGTKNRKARKNPNGPKDLSPAAPATGGKKQFKTETQRAPKSKHVRSPRTKNGRRGHKAHA